MAVSSGWTVIQEIEKTLKKYPNHNTNANQQWFSQQRTHNETTAMLVFQAGPVRVEPFCYVKTFFCLNKLFLLYALHICALPILFFVPID